MGPGRPSSPPIAWPPTNSPLGERPAPRTPAPQPDSLERARGPSRTRTSPPPHDTPTLSGRRHSGPTRTGTPATPSPCHPGRADILHGAPESFDRSVTGTAPPVQAGTQRGEHLDHVTDQVTVNLPGIDRNDFPALRRQRRLEMLDPETGQPASMLDHHRRGRGVRQQSGKLASFPLHARPDLDHPLIHRQTVPSHPLRQPGHLPVKVAPLVKRQHLRIEHRPTLVRRTSRCHLDQERARRGPHCRDRQLAVTEPPPRRLIVNTFPSRPLRQPHTNGIAHTFDRKHRHSSQQFAPPRPWSRAGAGHRFRARRGFPMDRLSNAESAISQHLRSGQTVGDPHRTSSGPTGVAPPLRPAG